MQSCQCSETYKEHHSDQQYIVLLHRWSLYIISTNIENTQYYKFGPYKQVVFIYRWSLEEVWLYVQLIQLHCMCDAQNTCEYAPVDTCDVVDFY